MSWEKREAVFKEITKRTASRIQLAHQRGDDLRKLAEFVESECVAGADLQQAINTSWACFPEATLQEELTDIVEMVNRKQV